MKKFRISAAVLLAAFIIPGTVLVSSCRKKKDTIAKVYVRDLSNVSVAGCKVVLEGVPSSDEDGNISNHNNLVLYDTVVTNAAGEAIFNFNDVYQLGQVGVSVLKIKAFYGNKSAEGIINIEQETTSEETVYI